MAKKLTGLTQSEVEARKHLGWRQLYGRWWEPHSLDLEGKIKIPRPDYLVEWACYMLHDQLSLGVAIPKLCESAKGDPELGLQTKAEHFRRYVSCILAHKGTSKPFTWNPNAILITDKYFEYDFISIAGHGSSSKTETVSAIALCEFLASPKTTKVIVSSTTLKEARGRIWGRIEHYWQEAEEFFRSHAIPGLRQGLPIPGELVTSQGFIRMAMDGKKDDTKGIALAPGKESEVKEGIGRMKGFKASRMRVFLDEASDLSHKLLDAAETNLILAADFKLLATFNPASRFDVAGNLSEPKAGWDSVNVLESEGWITTRPKGYCIRFDGETSPNVIAGYDKYPGLLTKERLEERRIALGDNSTRFMEQYRGAWSTTGHADGIYSEAEIVKYLGMKKVEVWVGKPKMCAGFDPSFAHGGDRAALVILKTAEAITNALTKPVAEVVEVIYLDDNLDTTKDKKELILARLKKEMQAHGVPASNLAMDASGGGDPFATLMAQDPFFGTQFIRVRFGAKGSEIQAPGSGGQKGKDRYDNMASELWYAGKAYLRCGQIKGLSGGLIREMTLRLYTEVGKPPKIRIETKEDMKGRLQGRSPDSADAYFLALYAARVRCGFTCTEKVLAAAKQAGKSEHPLGNLIAWGQKKPQQMGEPVLASTEGAGWDRGYDSGASGGFGGMFGVR